MICFTKSECDTIINYSNTLDKNIRDGENADVSRPNKNISYVYYHIKRNEETQWIFDRINLFLKENDNIIVKKDLDTLHMHHYSKGDVFVKHRDIYYDGQRWNIGVCLNDDYDGGEFILYQPTEIIPKKAGTIYSFKNTREHEVLEIKSGERWSIIGFFFNEHIETNKNIF